MTCTLLAVLGVGVVISGFGKPDSGEFGSQDLKSLTDPRPSAKRLSLFNASIDMLREGLAQRHFTSVDLVKVGPNFRFVQRNFSKLLQNPIHALKY